MYIVSEKAKIFWNGWSTKNECDSIFSLSQAVSCLTKFKKVSSIFRTLDRYIMIVYSRRIYIVI